TYIIQEGRFQYVNPKFAEVFGYAQDEIISSRSVPDLIAEDDRAMVAEQIRKRIEGELDAIHYTFRGMTKNQKAIDVEVYGSRTSYRGRPAVIGTLLDVTERIRSEVLLKQTEEKYRSIFENAMEGIFQSTPEGQTIEANPALAKMLGFRSAPELKRALTDVKHQLYVRPKHRAEFLNLLEQRGVVYGFQCEFFKKNKSVILVSMNARAVRDRRGATLYYEGTVEDITEKKKAEDALRRLNEFNQAIIHNAPVAVFTLDKKGVITSVNPALADLSGLGAQAEKKLIGFNWLRNPYSVQCGLAEHIKKGLKGEAFQLWDFPFVNYRGDRDLFLEFQGVPLKGKDGAVEGLLCIIKETTERLKTRAKLLQEAQISAIGRLAAGIAHELNNPLATLVAHSELAGNCLESWQGQVDQPSAMKELKDYLKIIEFQAFRCKNVVNEILELPWKEGFEITRVDLNRLLENILECIAIKGKIVKELKPALPPVKGDASALRQVLVNLLNNAVDAVEGRARATIWIRTRVKGSHVQVEIEDNGLGIPEAIREKIYEPFFTTKESKKGVGLGLSLCLDFLSHMQGTIKAKSKPGRGTTFLVTLPAA
ncbi:MAG: PAS domain S-box protein, partial [Deltaproteobacteria bacterium]|nr:PAS domain S-box protein [Deltaproteobacteria bacterium]